MREHLRACAKCRSLKAPIEIFCRDCQELAVEFRNSERDLLQEAYPFEVYSLYTWYDEVDSIVRPLIYALKGGLIQRPWTDFAEDLVFRRSLIGFHLPEQIVLPPRKNARDHAWYWAKALGHLLRVPIADFLVSDDIQSSQKQLNIQRRKERQMHWRGEDLSQKNLLFVDDAITSGATAQAAHLALGSPTNFEVWTLVARPRHGVIASSRHIC